jgi:hypothetical protein
VAAETESEGRVTTSVEQIVTLLKQRKDKAGPALAKAREVRDTYNGDLVVAIPEMEASERVAVANQIQIGVDQIGKRIGSVMPHLDAPPLRRDIKASEKLARQRKLTWLGWWEDNRMPLTMYQRGRHLMGYGRSPVTVWPDMKNERPIWVPRDALNVYPAPALDPNEIVPPDCINVFTRSLAWLKSTYPEKIRALSLGKKKNGNDLYELVEFCDAEECVLVVLGNPAEEVGYRVETSGGTEQAVELLRYPNRAERPLTFVPTRITLDRPMSAFEGLVPLFALETKLAALQYIAASKGVFPEQWFVSSDQSFEPQIVQEAIPEIGQPGLVKGGTPVQQQLNPAYTSIQAVDRLEGAMRMEGGIPAEWTGQSATNIRTGRRGDAVLSQTVDFTLQEAQQLLAYSMQEENKAAAAIAKAYWGDERKSFYFGRGAARAKYDYIANTTFETDDNLVTYAYAGADTNGLTIEIGQNVGMGLLSKKSAMQMHPMIDDAELEHDRVVSEQLEAAVLSSIQQGAASGAIPPTDVARIMELVITDQLELAEAVAKAQEEAQQRQASVVPPGAPEAQPGIAEPGSGAEATVGPPPEGSKNVAALLGALRAPAMTLRGGPQAGA